MPAGLYNELMSFPVVSSKSSITIVVLLTVDFYGKSLIWKGYVD